MSYSKISVKENEHRAEEIDREGERVGKREVRALMHEAPPTQNPAGELLPTRRREDAYSGC